MTQSPPLASRHGRSHGTGSRDIYETLRRQIAQGVYGREGRLPSSRNLAAGLGVSRRTVTIAYEQLAAEGFIEVRQGARPVVIPPQGGGQRHGIAPPVAGKRALSRFGNLILSQRAPAGQPRGGVIADFRYGDLAPSDFPQSAWKRAMAAAMVPSSDRLAYVDPRGSPRLREALQGYLWRARRVECLPDQIIVTNGSQQGLDLCARLFLDPGDRFVIEDPCYMMARQIFAATGATPVSLPVDTDGLMTGHLAGVEARLAYVTPSHQFPLGGVLPVRRRHELAEWAARTGAVIVEDDYDSEFRYDINPVPPLYSLTGSPNILYLGTVSKTLSPALRIGYLVVPPDLIKPMARAKELIDRHSPLIEQTALALLIESGSYETHVRRARRRNAERRATLLNALRHLFGDRIRVEGSAAGLHVVVWFRDLPAARTEALLAAALDRGVRVHPVLPLYGAQAGAPVEAGLIMGYAALDPGSIERGIQLLSEAAAGL